MYSAHCTAHTYYVYKTEEGYLCAGYIFLDLFAREVVDFFFTKNQRTTVSNIYIRTYECSI